eukprot:g2614.t1
MATPNFMSSEADEFFFSEENVLQDKLEAGGCTLEEVLDEENFITLLAERDFSLISFLQEPANISQLVAYVSSFNANDEKSSSTYSKNETMTGSSNGEGDGTKTLTTTDDDTGTGPEESTLTELERRKREFKYPYMACEVLACDIAEIQNVILDDTQPGGLMDRIFDVVMTLPSPPEPLVQTSVSILSPQEQQEAEIKNEVQTIARERQYTYWEKIVISLLSRSSNKVLAYVNSSGRAPLFYTSFLQSLDNGSVADVLSKLILCADFAMKNMTADQNDSLHDSGSGVGGMVTAGGRGVQAMMGSSSEGNQNPGGIGGILEAAVENVMESIPGGNVSSGLESTLSLTINNSQASNKTLGLWQNWADFYSSDGEATTDSTESTTDDSTTTGGGGGAGVPSLDADVSKYNIDGIRMPLISGLLVLLRDGDKNEQPLAAAKEKSGGGGSSTEEKSRDVTNVHFGSATNVHFGFPPNVALFNNVTTLLIEIIEREVIDQNSLLDIDFLGSNDEDIASPSQAAHHHRGGIASGGLMRQTDEEEEEGEAGDIMGGNDSNHNRDTAGAVVGSSAFSEGGGGQNNEGANNTTSENISNHQQTKGRHRRRNRSSLGMENIPGLSQSSLSLASSHSGSSQQPETLIETLESRKAIQILIDVALNSQSEVPRMKSAAKVLIALLELNAKQEYENIDEGIKMSGAGDENIKFMEREEEIPTVVAELVRNVPQILKILEGSNGVAGTGVTSDVDVSGNAELFLNSTIENPATSHNADLPSRIPTSYSRKKTIPILGQRRLFAIQLVLALIKTRCHIVDKAIAENRILPACLDLFFQFPWNNVLHTDIFVLIHHILMPHQNGGGLLKRVLLTGAPTTSPYACHLIARILEAYQYNEAVACGNDTAAAKVGNDGREKEGSSNTSTREDQENTKTEEGISDNVTTGILGLAAANSEESTRERHRSSVYSTYSTGVLSSSLHDLTANTNIANSLGYMGHLHRICNNLYALTQGGISESVPASTLAEGQQMGAEANMKPKASFYMDQHAELLMRKDSSDDDENSVEANDNKDQGTVLQQSTEDIGSLAAVEATDTVLGSTAGMQNSNKIYSVRDVPFPKMSSSLKNKESSISPWKLPSNLVMGITKAEQLEMMCSLILASGGTRWHSFVEDKLAKINALEMYPLGGERPGSVLSNSESGLGLDLMDDDDFDAMDMNLNAISGGRHGEQNEGYMGEGTRGRESGTAEDFDDLGEFSSGMGLNDFVDDDDDSDDDEVDEDITGMSRFDEESLRARYGLPSPDEIVEREEEEEEGGNGQRDVLAEEQVESANFNGGDGQMNTDAGDSSSNVEDQGTADFATFPSATDETAAPDNTIDNNNVTTDPGEAWADFSAFENNEN